MVEESRGGGGDDPEDRPTPPLYRGSPAGDTPPGYRQIVRLTVPSSSALGLGTVHTETVGTVVLAPADPAVALLPPHADGVVLVVGVDVVGVLVVPAGEPWSYVSV